MEVLAFASFAVLVMTWLLAPSRAPMVATHTEEREAA
jgi:hypothetical protein